MTTYTTLPQDDSNLDVTLTESNDLITLDIQPAAVSVSGAVTSVNGQSGIVVLDTDDINQGTINLYYANSLVDAHLTGGTGVTYTAGDISIGQDVATDADVTFNTVTADDFIGDLNGSIRFEARADVDMSKGQVIYITGLQGNTSTIGLARSDSSSTMPAMGLVNADVTAGNNVEVVTFGNLKTLNVADFGETGITFGLGDVVYVSATEAGHLTNVVPGGETNFIQNIGMIQRDTPPANMTIKVGGAGRTNDTPNLNDGKIFIGDATNHTVESTLNTALVPEQTNLYHTTARVQNVIDANTAGFITASSVDTLTNKSGAISQWTNDAGYLTSETDSQTLSFVSPDLTISNGNTVDISSLISGLATTTYVDQAEADANTYTDTEIAAASIDGGTF